MNNQDHKLITIIIPIYNKKEYLGRCIDSIINQSYLNLEIMLINDGSTDGSGKICDAYALKDNRIRVFHVKNSGPASARNRGIEKSKGEFIYFVDADDFVEHNAIELLIEGYDRQPADIIVGDFNKIIDGKHDLGFSGIFSEDCLLTKKEIMDYARSYLKSPNKCLLFAFSWGRLFKSLIIKNNNIIFNEELHTFEDVEFNFKYLKYASSLLFIKQSAYHHLIHTNYSSATMTIADNPYKMFGYQSALLCINNYLKSDLTEEEISKEVGHAYVTLTIIQLVRICGQLNKSNKNNIYKLIDSLVNDCNLRNKLQHYSPSKGDSRILPLLMSFRLVWPIMLVCRYKAKKRYSKRRGIR